jgi:phage antirepressor YoqD-like protein
VELDELRSLLEAGRLALEVEQQQLQIQAMQPKADFFDAVTDSKDAIDIGNVAKIIDLGMGRNQLFEFLRSRNVLMRNNVPYQRYIDQELFRVIEQKYQKPDGSTHIGIKTLVFQKGVDYIIKWSSTENKWKLYDVTVPASPVLVATLSQDTQYPLGSLKTSWVFEDGYEGLIITRASCISPICVTFTVTEDPLDQISNTLYPVYDILDNLPSSTSVLKPVFIDCNESVKIEWNSFTNIYEIFVEGYKIGFTYISSGISNQWVILPNPVFDSLVSIETISGECPILPPPPVEE